jgi:hypothetical protein
MKSAIVYGYVVALLIFISCSNDNAAKRTPPETVVKNTSVSANVAQADGIVGEWEQQYTCFDKNGNYKLESEEKTASGTHLGFDWFKFNADGSCLRDKDIKFKGTYEIQEKSGKKKLLITGGDKLHYTITELTDKELILASDGAFIVFKRI